MYFLSMKLGCFCYFNDYAFDAMNYRGEGVFIYSNSRRWSRGVICGKVLKGHIKSSVLLGSGFKDVVSLFTYKMSFTC